MLRSLITNRIPSPVEVQSLLLVNSCSWGHALKAKQWVQSRLADAHVDYLLRYGYPQSYEGKDLKITNTATSLSLKIEFVRALRSKKYDVVIMCWTNERGFNTLKILGLLARGRSCIVFGDAGDGFWVRRSNLRVLLRFYLTRSPTFVKFFLRTAGFPFLALLGFLFVAVRVIYYSLKRGFYPILQNFKQVR